jgi:hypothetical protein
MPTWLYGVVVAGVIVALGLATLGALMWLTARGDEPSCDGEVDMGFAPTLVDAAEVEPFFQAVDDRCQFWLAIDERDMVVAYKPTVASLDCNVRWDIDLKSWRCDKVEVDPAVLDRWPLRIEDRDGLQHLLIDFGPEPN